MNWGCCLVCGMRYAVGQRAQHPSRVALDYAGAGVRIDWIHQYGDGGVVGVIKHAGGSYVFTRCSRRAEFWCRKADTREITYFRKSWAQAVHERIAAEQLARRLENAA